MDTISKVIFRQVRGGDLIGLHKLECDAFGENAYSLHVLKQYIEIFQPFFYIAHERSSFLSYAVGARVESSDVGWLLAIATHPTTRRSGLAYQLAKSVLQQMDQAGIKRVRVTVSPENEPSRKMLSRLGFHSGKLVKDYFGKGDDRIYFENMISNLDCK